MELFETGSWHRTRLLQPRPVPGTGPIKKGPALDPRTRRLTADAEVRVERVADAGARSLVGRTGAVDPAAGATVSLPGPQALRRAGMSGGDPVRAALGDPLAGAAPRSGKALREDLLAPAGRVAEARGLGTAGRAPAGSSGRVGGDRLGAGDHRRDDRAGEKGGAEIGKSPADRGRPASKLHLACDGRGVP